MQESFVDAAPHLGCSKVHPQPLTDRQPLSPTAQLLGGRHEDGGQVTISRREGRAHPAPLHLPKPHHHSDWSPWLSGETQQLSCPCSATQTWLLSPHLPADLNPRQLPQQEQNLNRKGPQSSGGTAQPRLALPAQAQRKEPDHPCPWQGNVCQHCRWATAASADNRWLPTGTAQAGFELVPKHRKLQAPSSAPSKFSSQNPRWERKRSLYVESLH